MISRLFITIAIFCINALCFAQLPKFGDVKLEDVRNNTYEADTSAAAVYLFHSASSEFLFTPSGQFRCETKYHYRIKILKEEGKDDYATHVVQIFKGPEISAENQTVMKGISAFTYNEVDGKLQKTKLDSKYIIKEQTSENIQSVKLAMQDVKVGSIIEYKYTLSEADPDIPSWYAQRDIPVVRAHFDARIASYFDFNYKLTGYSHLDFNKKDVNVTMSVGDGTITANGIDINIDGKDLPAMKDEGFMYNRNLYKTRVEFELRSFTIPGSTYQNFAVSWDQIRARILDSWGYAGYLKRSNPFKNEMASLELEGKNNIEKVASIFSFVKGKIKWDKVFGLHKPASFSKVIKDGKGSNTEINLILISMMREAGVPCTALLVKPRELGPIIHPSIDDIQCMVIAFNDEDGNIYFLDGSADYGYINVFDTTFRGNGILLEPGKVADKLGMYNLSELAGNVNKIRLNGMISPDGLFQGSQKETRYGMKSMGYKEDFNDKDSTEYVQDIEKDRDIQILSYRNVNCDGVGGTCSTTMRFSKQLNTDDSHIYFNPLILEDERKNHFTQETRKYPVDMPYPQSTQIEAYIAIPEGYEVEELPSEKVITMPDGEAAAKISFSVSGNMVVTKYVSELSAIIILPTQYQDLRKYFSDLVEMNDLNVVLKKK